MKLNPTVTIFSLFPESIQKVLDSSILRRAQVRGLINLQALDLRDFSQSKHRSVDDTPYGGGQGMLIRADVLGAAVDSRVKQLSNDRKRLKVIYTSPRGLRIDQEVVQGLASWLLEDQKSAHKNPREICIVCGRYEGVDERFVEQHVDLEVSVGDLILSGGEIASLLLCDAVVRLLPGVLGNDESARQDSFSNGLLEYPQYTRPAVYQQLEVPKEMMSGNHQEISQWRTTKSLLLTMAFRPDLIAKHTGEGLESWAVELLDILKDRLSKRG